MKHYNAEGARPTERGRWTSLAKLGITLGLVAGVGAAAAQTASASPATFAAGKLYVNATTGSDESGNATCRLQAHPCATLTQALSVAPNGSTIDVGPGTYPEQLAIGHDVTVVGSGASGKHATVIEPTSVSSGEIDTDSDTPQAAIVYVKPDTRVSLKDLTVNGTAASSTFDNCSTDYVGIYYRDAKGSLTNVDVTGVEQSPTAFGCQPGANGGVYVATDSSRTAPTGGTGSPTDWVAPPAGYESSIVTMRAVTVNNYDKNGITCDDVRTTCKITKSTVTGLGPISTNAQNGIQIWGASATVSHNLVRGNSYTSPQYNPPASTTYYTAAGILAINAGNLKVSGNMIEHNNVNVYALWDKSQGLAPAKQGKWILTGNNVSRAVDNTGTSAGSKPVPFGDGFGDGIDLDGARKAMVFHNTAIGDPEFGIGLFDTYRTVVWDNVTSHGGGDGIYVGDDAYNGTTNSGIAANVGPSLRNVILANKSSYNALDGILADVNSQERGNTFAYNTLVNNRRYDAEDLSKGKRTAATDNFWHLNLCTPAHDSNVPGICWTKGA